MDWVFDHLQLLFLIAVAVVAILQKLKRVQPGAGTGPVAEDAEQAERTRRIQEEIRRRIMERRGLVPGLPPESETGEGPPPFPAAPPMIEEVRPLVVPPPLEQVMSVPAVDQIREMERQQMLLQRLREPEAAQPRRSGAEPAPAPQAAAGTAVERKVGWLVADLRHPAGLRRAVVLREILGPPVGLQ
jgi:hypothetical protein